MKIALRARIAPSPTGMAHIGTGYIALFNWAFAKKHNGAFVLRLEDTDQKRHVPEAEQVIYDTLKWLGIEADESPIKEGTLGPYRQSQRLDMYKKVAEKLKIGGMAYEKDGALWLSIPKTGSFSWDDAVRGHIEFDVANLKDWVIVKSDGFPTYNFANVIDDSTMRITHVIRGEEHISNTPLQLSAYQALGLTPPLFAHLPVLRSADHKKLSKRRDPVSLLWFKEQGYLPAALLNFLALQGWSHPDGKELFSKEEFSKLLTLERVRTSAPIFDFQKLNWLNGEYIRALPDVEFIKLAASFSKIKLSPSQWKAIAPLAKDRTKVLSEIDSWVGFFSAPVTPLSSDFSKMTKEYLSHSLTVLTSCNWRKDTIQQTLLDAVDHTEGWKRGPFFMDLRLAITGKKISLPLIESMEILGKEECLKRIETVINERK